MKNLNKQSIFALLVVAILVMNSCQAPNSNVQNAGEKKGTISISGAWALYPMMIRWSEEYQDIYPDVMFDISAGGAGKGMADALAGAVDIGMVSREIHPEEIANGAFWVSVTKDAVFPTINENNPVWKTLNQQGATREMFINIFITGEVTTWEAVVEQPEMTDSIHIFTRSDACGAAATWADYLGGTQEDLLGVGVYGDPGLLDAVIKDPLGIGYNNLNYIFDMETGKPVEGVRLIPVDINNNRIADPSEVFESKEDAVMAVASGYYPSPPARELNLVTNGEPTGLVKDFLIWILSDGQKFVDDSGYIALPKDKLDEELGKLN
ncbi:MAG: PstS family phosphate ABC transporter substrate-binding protein [Anaerolineales bacterium]|jgi:phosphate transport system substrate-binding protein